MAVNNVHATVAHVRPPDRGWLPGGVFRMGSDRHYPEEAPAHRVRVDGFWIDPHPVTNAQFAALVAASGHAGFRCIVRAPQPQEAW